MAVPRGYYQQLFCTRICEGQPPGQIRVIHAVKKKKSYKIKFKSSESSVANAWPHFVFLIQHFVISCRPLHVRWLS